MNSPNVNTWVSCFADSPSSPYWGKSLKAFIFSLKKSEGLPPFKCFANDKDKAIYQSSFHGPSFGEGPFFRIYGKSAQRSRAYIEYPYVVPIEVNDKGEVLAGTDKLFSPDNYEVLYLA